MSDSIRVSAAAQHGDQATRGHGLRGALVLMAAAGMLVAGTYFVVFSLTGPNGLFTHMASQASADVDGRTLSVAAENY